MLKRIIFNADDFGLSSGVNRAIIESHKNGVVNSTSALGNCDEKLLIEAADLAKQNPQLGVGVHLVLTTRKPLIDTHKTLVDQQGFFNVNDAKLSENLDLDEVYEEWKAQILRLKSHFNLTHLDSHHHVHLDENLYKVIRRLSREFKLPIRSVRDNLPFEVKADLGFFGQEATVEYLKNRISQLYGLVEFMVHPGLKDDLFLQEISSYNEARAKELDILCSEELKSFLIENRIKNINYGQIKRK